MRILILMTGAQGSGKSTLIRKLGLHDYTLCPDELRLLYQAPVLGKYGQTGISQKNDKKVWRMVFELLERRMERGELTVVDATHTTRDAFNKYKKLVNKYRYRVYILSTRDIPKEVALQRNEDRLKTDPTKYVPPEVIEKSYARFNSPVGRIPKWATLIKADEADKLIDALKWHEQDFNQYDKVVVIGDVHACLDPLKKLVGPKEVFVNRSNWAFVFVGDIPDRGPQNAETIKYVLDIYKLPNVYFLIGNHEKWLWYYAIDQIQEIRSREFLEHTMPELDEAGIDKKELRQFYRSLLQALKFQFRDKHFLVTHGGIPIYDFDARISTQQLIHGVGDYKDSDIVDDTFAKLVGDKPYYSIHGHRNVSGVGMKVNEHAFNLEGRVEAGGYLRAILIDSDGKIYPLSVKNDNFRKDIALSNRSPILPPAFHEFDNLVQALTEHKGIVRKDLNDHIVSFNFSKKTFKEGSWDAYTVLARSFFVNIKEKTIAARAYHKFFRVNETPKTQLVNLGTMKFPADAFLKYNGYLGLIGWDDTENRPLYATKSVIESPMVKSFKEIYAAQATPEQIKKAEELAKTKSLIFEVIDPENDPHIIKYTEKKIVLLDVLDRSIQLRPTPYDELKKIAAEIGVPVKEKVKTFQNFNEFYNWYRKIMEEELIFEEGYVVVDRLGFMVKVKTPYYSFWKYMRSFKDRVLRSPRGRRISTLTGTHSKLMVEVIDYLWDKGPEFLKDKTIIDVREHFIRERRDGKEPKVSEYKNV